MRRWTTHSGSCGRAVATELHVFPGTCHGFDSLVPEWDTSQRLFDLQGAALRRALWGD